MNLRNHKNSAIEIVADIGLLVICSKNIFFWDNWEKNWSPFTANFSPSNKLILVFLRYPEVPRNQQKPKEILWLLIVTPIIFRVCQPFSIFDFFNFLFFFFFFKRFIIKFWIWKSNWFFPFSSCGAQK